MFLMSPPISYFFLTESTFEKKKHLCLLNQIKNEPIRFLYSQQSHVITALLNAGSFLFHSSWKKTPDTLDENSCQCCRVGPSPASFLFLSPLLSSCSSAPSSPSPLLADHNWSGRCATSSGSSVQAALSVGLAKVEAENFSSCEDSQYLTESTGIQHLLTVWWLPAEEIPEGSMDSVHSAALKVRSRHFCVKNRQTLTCPVEIRLLLQLCSVTQTSLSLQKNKATLTFNGF